MHNGNELFSKLIIDYDLGKRKKITDLNNKIWKLNLELKKQNKRYIKNLELKKVLKKKETNINNIYDKLIYILKSRGIIFEIAAKNIDVDEWENLYIKLLNKKYRLVDKNNKIIYDIEDRYCNSIEYIIRNFKYSVIVMRKDVYFIKLQLRIV